jgi:tRNA A37 threonylcarbamoyladenosine dehydratase
VSLYLVYKQQQQQSQSSGSDVSDYVQNISEDAREHPIEIKNELFSRINSFFGEQKFTDMENSFVIVVGLGGVGSHAANMLVRSGIKKIRLIDFDQVTLSSLNRHAVAYMEDVGKSKAETMYRRLRKVVPWAEIDYIAELFKGSEADRLLAGKPTFVLDCIDDVNTKAELIAYCVHNNIKILTSMGAGGKADPTRMKIAPLSDCINDPLATKIKWKLKKFNAKAEDVMAVFSIEKPVVDLLPLDEEQAAAPQDFGTLDYMRLRVVPVLGTSPSIFGQAMASYVLCNLAGREYEPEGVEKLSRNLKHRMRQHLQNNEIRRFGTSEGIDLDDEDLELIVSQIWRGRCAVTGRKFGGHSTSQLTRWRADKAPTPFNLVLMLPNELAKVENGGIDSFSADVVARIDARLAWAEETYGDDYTLDFSKRASRANKLIGSNTTVHGDRGTGLLIALTGLLTFSVGYLTGTSSI